MRGISISHAAMIRYGQRIIEPATIEFAPGSCVGLVGLNGAGKTTWLYGLAGFIPNAAPAIHARDHEIKSFGLLLQHPTLPEWLTVAEVLELLVRPSPLLSALAARWRIDALLNRKAGHLSKGQTQLIGAIITLESRHTLRCLDEPFAALDLTRRRELIRRLLALRHEGDDVTILTAQVASDLYETCTDILMLRDGELRVVGSVEEMSAYGGRDPRAVFEECIVMLLTE